MPAAGPRRACLDCLVTFLDLDIRLVRARLGFEPLACTHANKSRLDRARDTRGQVRGRCWAAKQCSPSTVHPPFGWHGQQPQWPPGLWSTRVVALCAGVGVIKPHCRFAPYIAIYELSSARFSGRRYRQRRRVQRTDAFRGAVQAPGVLAGAIVAIGYKASRPRVACPVASPVASSHPYPHHVASTTSQGQVDQSVAGLQRPPTSGGSVGFACHHLARVGGLSFSFSCSGLVSPLGGSGDRNRG